MTQRQEHSAAGPTLIGSVRRALRLLDVLVAHPRGATAKQLAREAGLPLPTTYHLLRTLIHERYVRRVDGMFALDTEATARLASVAARAARQQALEERLTRLRDSLQAAVYLGCYREGEIQVLLTASDDRCPPVAEWVDLRVSGHAHALGQAMLLEMDEDERRDHLSRHPVCRLTSRTVRDDSELLRRLARLRRGTPVCETAEYAPDAVCGAVGIRLGAMVAAVGISLPLHQRQRLTEVTEALRAEVENGLLLLPFSLGSISI
ncbi:helix-turn-helix domain-containing protein [Streptomyces sp. YIM 98790]|uniref:IclR family transcriptional regulator n=1 Tax=Streptomyces sp. YIM 98790 TaxID=2689077 RepID=UPI0028BE8EBD|nr:helix-turn-helix domain-containing protein [Streptomyces sp. YIM 98790]